jgi:uncharacterized protein (TIGR02284 family)
MNASPVPPSKSVVFALNGLIETCTDGEKGYSFAAADVRDEVLKARLRLYSDERAKFVAELQCAIRRLGAAPENEGTLRGTLHRTLMELRDALEIRSDRLVLEECERGDRAALGDYERVLRQLHDKLSPDVRAMLDRHAGALRTCLKELEDR